MPHIDQVRWTSYEPTDDAWICPAGDRQPSAPVEADGSLVSRFAAIVAGAERVEDAVPKLCAFYGDFGLLGYSLLTNQLHQRRRPDGRIDLCEGDPVWWALAHVANVVEILGLAKDRGSALDRRLAETAKQHAAAAIQIPTVGPHMVQLQEDVAAALHVPPSFPVTNRQGVARLYGVEAAVRVDAAEDAASRARAPLAVARRLLAERLNPNLVGVVRVYDAEAAGPRFAVRVLVEAIYWELADRLETRTTIRRCPCGALFFAIDQRQKHCPPREGQRESACAKRFRMRRLRREALHHPAAWREKGSGRSRKRNYR